MPKRKAAPAPQADEIEQCTSSSSSSSDEEQEEQGGGRGKPGALQLDNELEALAQAAERKVHVEREINAASAGERANPAKQKKSRWKNRKTAFVNQLPYSATAEQIASHFAHCGAAVEMQVRPVINRKTKTFRGIAFLDFANDSALQKALAMNQSTFTNGAEERQINVTEATNKNDDKNLTAAQENKFSMSKDSIAKVEALVAAEVATGTLREDDFDHRAKDFLHSVPEAVALNAVREFAALDLSTVNNRCAALSTSSA